MSNGATDGAYLRAAGIPTYGVDGLWGITPDDDRSHGRDERVPVEAFYGNLDHWYIMLMRLAGGGK
jgi:acetylornithine deacetylase/succinyl-diaminopimelate desuccinylase-like protein